MLPAEVDRRWGTEGASTPWYPTMRLFRRGRGGDWAPTVSAVAQALRARAAPTLVPRVPRAEGRPLDVLFDWGVASTFGWGLYGLNLLLAWADRTDLRAGCVAPHRAEEIDVDPVEAAAIRPALDRSAVFARDLAAVAGRSATTSGVVLHALHNGLQRNRAVYDVDLQGTPSVAVAFLDRTDFLPERAEALRRYPLVVAGSSWNAALLREAGAPRVELLLQGVDTSHFHPAPRRGLFGDCFVIFSASKPEGRKGQDLVVRAFQTFSARRPDALLLTAWSSPWTGYARELAAAPGLQPPTFGADGKLDVPAWCEANGIPRHQIRALPVLPNRVLPRLLREADVALFPNRAEGGTNLVAMECMACGVPTVLSANTGHLDLLEGEGATPLLRQAAMTDPGCSGWGESDVDEVVETLERAYGDRDAATARGSTLHDGPDVTAADGPVRGAGAVLPLRAELIVGCRTCTTSWCGNELLWRETAAGKDGRTRRRFEHFFPCPLRRTVEECHYA